MISSRVARRRALWYGLLVVAAGCAGPNAEESTTDGPDFSNLAPVSGVITLNGEPLGGAVVTFLPPRWSPGVGETNAKGEYTLTSSGRPGVAPGDYKVAISLLLSAEGVSQGVAVRSSLAQPPSMLTAKEFLPREYADLSRSKLTAHVDQKGGNFDFDVKAPGLVVPTRHASKAENPGAAAVEKPPTEAPPGPDASNPATKDATPP